jgi:hypothetical protein
VKIYLIYAPFKDRSTRRIKFGSSPFAIAGRLTGITQFRLRFEKDDDNDKIADIIAFYAGDEANALWRPVLGIEYYVP